MNPKYPAAIEPIRQAFLNGRLVVFPTDTVFGIGALFGDPVLLQRLKSAKQRPENKALPIMVRSIDMAEKIVQIDPRARRIMETFLPGPLTVILPLRDSVDRSFFNGLASAAVRIPDHSLLLDILEAIDSPIYATSANLSGEPEARRLSDLADMALDYDLAVCGQCDHQQASTIIDLTSPELRIVREGPISSEQIRQALEDGPTIPSS